jgi:hypothetical protein
LAWGGRASVALECRGYGVFDLSPSARHLAVVEMEGGLSWAGKPQRLCIVQVLGTLGCPVLAAVQNARDERRHDH